MKDYCTVEGGLFVKPCNSLESVIDNYAPEFLRTKGIFSQTLTNMETRKPARTYIGVKSKNRTNGFLFNFCPFCGSKIDAPFNKEEPNE